MNPEVVSRLRAHCIESDLDAVVCISPENVAYAAGFVIPSQPLMRWRHAAVVVTANGQDAIVCVDMEETTVRTARPDATVGVWMEFTGDAMQTLAGVLEDLGLRAGRIGIELDYLPANDHAALTQRLPDACFSSADAMLARSREVKTPTEIELLARLSRISDRAIVEAFASVKAGDTEMDIAAALTRSVYEQGAQQFKLMIVATGERSQLPNVGPTTRVLVPGDVCRVEIFSIIDGYHAGVCRTAVVGEPSPDAERVYRNLVECRELVLDAMRPGAVAQDVYQVFRSKFDELGMPPISFVGHSIGVNLHETPYLGPDDKTVLQPGMIFGMEPLVYRSGFGFGMQIKDMVAIDERGARLLSDVADTDALYRITG
jgi:Xaa-Pro dipeptidase